MARLLIRHSVVEGRLDRLSRWGAVSRDHDAALASSAAEWRRNRFTYDLPRPDA